MKHNVTIHSWRMNDNMNGSRDCKSLRPKRYERFVTSYLAHSLTTRSDIVGRCFHPRMRNDTFSRICLFVCLSVCLFAILLTFNSLDIESSIVYGMHVHLQNRQVSSYQGCLKCHPSTSGFRESMRQCDCNCSDKFIQSFRQPLA